MFSTLIFGYQLFGEFLIWISWCLPYTVSGSLILMELKKISYHSYFIVIPGAYVLLSLIFSISL